jgi:hypothetical protein
MDLDQVDPVGLEPLEAVVDLHPGALGVTRLRLGRQEDAVADPRHPRSEPQLGIAVAGGNVEVVDAGVERELDRLVGDVLADLGEAGRAVDEDRALMADAAEPPILHSGPSLVWRWSAVGSAVPPGSQGADATPPPRLAPVVQPG